MQGDRHKDNCLTEQLNDGLCLHMDNNNFFKDMAESNCNCCLSIKGYEITDNLKLSSKVVMILRLQALNPMMSFCLFCGK